MVVEVGATGICRSDWHAWIGHDPDVAPPHVPGHELAGTVVAAGPEVRRAWRSAGASRRRSAWAAALRAVPGGGDAVCDDDYQPGFTGRGSCAQLVALPHADLNLVGCRTRSASSTPPRSAAAS